MVEPESVALHELSHGQLPFQASLSNQVVPPFRKDLVTRELGIEAFEVDEEAAP
jgi:hypothetical protein